VVGEKHLKLKLARAGRTVEAMRFNALDPCLNRARGVPALGQRVQRRAETCQLGHRTLGTRTMSLARIRISWPKGAVSATLDDTPTARGLVAALPVEARAQTWGEEVYFQVPVKATLESGAKQVVPPGTVCLWVEGSSLALPWGRTPYPKGDESAPGDPLQRARHDRR